MLDCLFQLSEVRVELLFEIWVEITAARLRCLKARCRCRFLVLVQQPDLLNLQVKFSRAVFWCQTGVYHGFWLGWRALRFLPIAATQTLTFIWPGGTAFSAIAFKRDALEIWLSWFEVGLDWMFEWNGAIPFNCGRSRAAFRQVHVFADCFHLLTLLLVWACIIHI